MVCNLVTYRARSAVREVGHALGFPRPLVDRVAKALETYDSVMVRRDLQADGGFAEFFGGRGTSPASPGAWREPPVAECCRGPARRPRSGPVAPPTTRADRATRRRASPGSCGAGPAATVPDPRDGHTFGPGAGPPRGPSAAPGTIAGRALDPESGVLRPPARNVDRLGRPRHFDPPPAPRGAPPAVTAPAVATPSVTPPAAAAAGPAGMITLRPRPSRASSRSPRPRRAGAAPSGCRPGSAGWSCAPGSTASRATSASTPAECS